MRKNRAAVGPSAAASSRVPLLLLALSQIVSWGVLYYSFGVWVQPFAGRLGTTAQHLTTAFSIVLLLSGLFAVPTGYALDRWGAKRIMVSGQVFGASLLFILSFSASASGFYWSFLLMGPILSLSLYEPAFFAITQWSARNWVRDLGLFTLLAGSSSVLFVPLTAVLVSRTSSPEAMRILALLLLIGGVSPAWLALNLRPPRTPSGGVRKLSLPDAGFLIASAPFLLSAVLSAGLGSQLYPLLLQRGQTPSVAAGIVSWMGLAGLGGRLLLFVLPTKFSSSVLVASAMTTVGVGSLILMTGFHTTGTWFAATLFGLALGTMAPLRAAHVADNSGQNYGSYGGFLAMSASVVGSAGPMLVASGNLLALAAIALVGSVWALISYRVKG